MQAKGTDANPTALVVLGEGVMARVRREDAGKEMAATLRSVACRMAQLRPEGPGVTLTVLASEKVSFVETLGMVYETRMGQQALRREGGHV